MNKIADFFGAPLAHVRPIIQPQIVRQVRNEWVVLEENTVNQEHKRIGRTRDT